jgi:hypothetical protein
MYQPCAELVAVHESRNLPTWTGKRGCQTWVGGMYTC